MNKKRVNKYPKAFRQMAVERMRNCDNISELTKELGVDRSALYHWRNLTPGEAGATAKSPMRELRCPVRHRSPETQADLAVVRSRNAVVAARTQLVNSVRGMVKAVGGRLPKSTTAAFAQNALPQVPEALTLAVVPLLKSIGVLTEQIQHYDQQIVQLAEKKYPQTRLLRQVKGVGPLIALTYVLTIEDPARFRRSREVGSFLGLRPKQHESGDSAPQLGITKGGNNHLRWLLVQAAQYTLSRLAPDSRLRRWGLQLAMRGGKNAKKRAVVAVARKLAVLLHRLWVTGEVYDPLYGVEAEAA